MYFEYNICFQFFLIVTSSEVSLLWQPKLESTEHFEKHKIFPQISNQYASRKGHTKHLKSDLLLILAIWMVNKCKNIIHKYSKPEIADK